MKTTHLLRQIALCALSGLALLHVPGAIAQEAENADTTLSPYFFVNSDDPQADALPLRSTSAQVDIAGVIADVKVKQVYKNEGQKPLEAIYIFPGSTRPAVYGMKMTIGEREIVAKIEEKQAARAQYEQAKQEGKSASLLEQQRPNVFQMNVANIMPGDEIVVELSYTELLAPTDGLYEFVYPTVVGPRYSNQPAASAPQSEQWVKNPYLHEGEKPPYPFDIQVNLSAGLPIQQAICPSHAVDIDYESKAFASVKLAESDKDGGNKDFILQYQLAGGQIESGLLLFHPTPAPSQKGNAENFFLLMAQPPKRVTPEQIPQREYIFIVDVSGSMHGFPLDISKTLMRNLLGNLNANERFNVLLFSGGSAVLSEGQSLPATPQNIQSAVQFIDQQQGGGGTEILPALQRALALPRAEGMSRSVVIVTDGYVNVETSVFDLIRGKLGDANMFAFGIGSSVNRFLIEGMARMGMGEPLIITEPGSAAAQAEKFRQYIQTPVLTQIALDFQGFDAYDIEPLSIPDVLAERPVIVFGKWRGEAKGTLQLRGFTGGQTSTQRVTVSDAAPRAENAALRYLWARHRIAILGDYNLLEPNNERVKEITSLGLTYNLLTQYTSFVAIDSEIRNKDGETTTIKQPLPLPEGVSDLAVGSSRTVAQYAAPAPKFAATKFGANGLQTLVEPHPAEAPMSTRSTEATGTAADMIAEPEVPVEKKKDKQAQTQTIRSKTFTLINGMWIDAAHSPAAKLITIKRDSQAYRDLLARLPELKAYFELGERVIVNLGAYSVEIADTGNTELTGEEWQRLLTSAT